MKSATKKQTKRVKLTKSMNGYLENIIKADVKIAELMAELLDEDTIIRIVIGSTIINELVVNEWSGYTKPVKLTEHQIDYLEKLINDDSDLAELTNDDFVRRTVTGRSILNIIKTHKYAPKKIYKK